MKRSRISSFAFGLKCPALWALAATLACGSSLGCQEQSSGISADPPTWSFSQKQADGTQLNVSFFANTQGQIYGYSTQTQTPDGALYFGKGAPDPKDIETLQQLTTTAAIEALGPNFRRLDELDGPELGVRAPSTEAAQISLWPQECSWPQNDHCGAARGSLAMSPKNPSVEALTTFFVDFTLRHRGILGQPMAGTGAGSTGPL